MGAWTFRPCSEAEREALHAGVLTQTVESSTFKPGAVFFHFVCGVVCPECFGVRAPLNPKCYIRKSKPKALKP